MDRKDKSDKNVEALLENLRLHQVELEIQNEELKQAQQVIEEGRQKLADLYDFAPVGYLTVNTENIIEEANLTAAALFGVSRQHLVGMPFLQFVDAEYSHEYLLHRENVVNTNEKAVCQLLLRKRGGVHFWGRLESVPVPPVHGDGKSVSLRMAVIDIEEQKVAEQALQESEKKYRDLVESVNSIIVRVDSEGRVVFLNDYGRNLFGYTSEELWAQGLVGTVLPSGCTDRPEMKAFLGNMAKHSEEYREKELEMTRRNGDKVWVSWTTRTLRDEKGNFAGILAVGNDITEGKRLEAELRQSQKMEAIGTLAGGIAHDFNNMLAAVIGFAEMVEEDLPPDSPSIPSIKRVLEAASRGRDLVRQILAFSRKAELARTFLSISPILAETMQFLRASLPTTIEIKLTMHAVRDTVLASSMEIQQILMNLATNASFAMRERGGIMEIALTNIEFKPGSQVPDVDTEPGKYVQITVSDTGSGMTPNVIQRIFEPFFTTKGVGEGTGMGLSVVYGIVKTLRGSIAVESEPGEGSTFRIFLPVAAMQDKAEGGQTSSVPRGSERLLFVDDEQFIKEWGQTVLERLGYTVTAFSDSTEALEIFSADPGRFDLVITDQTMPKLAGLQLARKILAIRHDMPVILCTGHSDNIDPQKVKKAGVKELLIKPLGKKELGEAIRRALHADS